MGGTLCAYPRTDDCGNFVELIIIHEMFPPQPLVDICADRDPSGSINSDAPLRHLFSLYCTLCWPPIVTMRLDFPLPNKKIVPLKEPAVLIFSAFKLSGRNYPSLFFVFV